MRLYKTLTRLLSGGAKTLSTLLPHACCQAEWLAACLLPGVELPVRRRTGSWSLVASAALSLGGAAGT